LDNVGAWPRGHATTYPKPNPNLTPNHNNNPTLTMTLMWAWHLESITAD